MFYSHEILTSRKHGVATVWLVATLGSKSALRKINRKTILDVDLLKACETITNPEAPLALRLQGNLLYGVSRVFSQQCTYIFTDVQQLSEHMRGAKVIPKDAQLDATVAVTRPEQLNLPDDPAFDVDFDMGLDLSLFGFMGNTTNSSSSLSPHTLQSSRSNLQSADDNEEPMLELPLGSTPAADFMDFDLDHGPATSSIMKIGSYAPVESGLSEQLIYEDDGFQINDDGELIDREELARLLNEPLPVQNTVNPRVLTQAKMDIDDVNVFDLDNDDQTIEEHREPGTSQLALSMLPPLYAGPQPPTVSASSIHSVVDIEAPDTKAVARQRSSIQKPPQPDQETEVSNRKLSEWNTEYVWLSDRNRWDKLNRTSIAQAKRNAAFWMLEQGIGGVKAKFGNEISPHPFAIFSGTELLKSLIRPLGGKKRSHDGLSDEESDGPASRKSRPRSAEADLGRAVNTMPILDDNDAFAIHYDDQSEPEIGRQAQSSLKEYSSQMPWNPPSHRTSSRLYSGIPRGMSSSIGGVAGVEYGPPSNIASRRSRLTSASPLFGKGRIMSRQSSIDIVSSAEHLPLDVIDVGDPDSINTEDYNEAFELYGPAAAVSTQQAADSQWLNATFENEARNFFTFLVSHARLHNEASGIDGKLGTKFESLLPPATNSQIVAAQGLLHVLTLASKGLIQVQQSIAFGGIEICTSVSELSSDASSRKTRSQPQDSE